MDKNKKTYFVIAISSFLIWLAIAMFLYFGLK